MRTPGVRNSPSNPQRSCFRFETGGPCPPRPAMRRRCAGSPNSRRLDSTARLPTQSRPCRSSPNTARPKARADARRATCRARARPGRCDPTAGGASDQRSRRNGDSHRPSPDPARPSRRYKRTRSDCRPRPLPPRTHPSDQPLQTSGETAGPDNARATRRRAAARHGSLPPTKSKRRNQQRVLEGNSMRQLGGSRQPPIGDYLNLNEARRRPDG